MSSRRCQRIGPALVLAARSFATPRPGCGVLAAGVQQRLTIAADLRAALTVLPRGRHQHALIAGADDIAMGAEALTESGSLVLRYPSVVVRTEELLIANQLLRAHGMAA